MLTNGKIAAIALIMAFVACLLILPLQMINDIVFRQRELQPACSPRKPPAVCSKTAITISRATWAAPPSSLPSRKMPWSPRAKASRISLMLSAKKH